MADIVNRFITSQIRLNYAEVLLALKPKLDNLANHGLTRFYAQGKPYPTWHDEVLIKPRLEGDNQDDVSRANSHRTFGYGRSL